MNSRNSLAVFALLLSISVITACGGGSGSGGGDDEAASETIDDTPAAFSFTDRTDAGLGLAVTSNSITVSGINASTAISITGGEYAIGGGGFTTAAGVVENGQTVTVRQTASGNFSTTTDTTLTIGGVSNTFSVTTVALDTTPDAFTFIDQFDVTPNTLIPSNTVTITGINSSASISVTGGEYAIDGGGFSAVAGTVDNGQTVTLRQTSSAIFSTVTGATLTVGGVSDSFVLRTEDADTTPDAFSLIDQTDVALNAQISSNAITVNGINAPAPITVNSGGEYSIDGGAFTADNGFVNNGQRVVVRQTSSSNSSTTTSVALIIGGVADAFSVTTGVYELSVSGDLKQLQFSWPSVPGATAYRFYQNPDGASGFSQVGGDLLTTSASIDISVHLHDWNNALYLVEACTAGDCIQSSPVGTQSVMLDTIGYFKASNADDVDQFSKVVVSGDGNTMVVGSVWEASDATGIDGNQGNSSLLFPGAAYVFVRSGSSWSQQAYIKASNTDGGDMFGQSMALSDDGNILAIGAPGEQSNSAANQNNDSLTSAGAVYLFTRSGTTWSQQDYIKAWTPASFDNFGGSVALSSNGNTLAVTGANRVFVYLRSVNFWLEQAYFGGVNLDANDGNASSVALSDDGDTLAVGYQLEDGGIAGIDGDETDDTEPNSGAVFVFTRSGSSWSQQAYIKASNPDGDNSSFSADIFGVSLALSDDGDTLAVGARGEDSLAAGIDGNQADNGGQYVGAVYLFTRNLTTWSQQAYVKASNPNNRDVFGSSVALSGDGSLLAVGAAFTATFPGNDGEDSDATGIGGNESDNSATDAGAAYLFSRSGSSWSQRTYIKAPNTDSSDLFGVAVSISDDGSMLAVGASGEDSSVSGIGGDQSNNDGDRTGAVYLY